MSSKNNKSIHNQNSFDDYLRHVSESRQNAEAIRAKIVGSKCILLKRPTLFSHFNLTAYISWTVGELELNAIKKSYNQKSKALEEVNAEITGLTTANKELKNNLMKALIDRDELVTKKNCLSDNIDRLKHHIETMEGESDIILRDDDIDCIRERYSMTQQLSLVSKLQDARCKLLKYGVPSHLYWWC